MDAGNFKPDVLLDTLVILTDILYGLLCRTTAVPVLLLPALAMVSIVPAVVSLTVLSLLGTVTGSLSILLTLVVTVVLTAFAVLVTFTAGTVIVLRL